MLAHTGEACAPAEAVLFDLDGTLIDSTPLILRSFRAVAAAHGLPVPENERLCRMVMGIPLMDGLAALWPATSLEEREQLADDYRRVNRAEHDASIRAVAGARFALKALGALGIPSAVVTSKGRELAVRGLTVTGLYPYCGHILGNESTTRHKPDPAPLLHAAKLLDVEPGRTVYVGDAVPDMLAAGRAGMAALGIATGAASAAELLAAGAHRVMTDLFEIFPLPAVVGGQVHHTRSR